MRPEIAEETARTAVSPEWSYWYRSSALSAQKNYRLEGETLVLTDGKHQSRIPYQEIDRMKIYQERFLGSSQSYWCNVLYCRSGRKIKLGAAHHVGFRDIEDRSASYFPFVKELEARVQRYNPNVFVLDGNHWRRRREHVAARAAVALLRGARRLTPDRNSAILAGAMRVIGPRLPGHRLARANLAAAYPQASAAEVAKILSGMWDNLARTCAEYAHLDQLADYDLTRPNSGRIIMDQTTADRAIMMNKSREPALVFGAHLANWELPPTLPPFVGRQAAFLYKPPAMSVLAEEILKIRKVAMGTMIAADGLAGTKLKQAIERGALVGMLTDQHHPSGVEVIFFGRVCKFHPVVARLARNFNCPIHGARTIRLSGSRFRYEITEPIDAPRDRSGKIDVARTTQLIAHIVEGWIREHPEQWLWLHRLWR